jgi:hypothetical protein
LEAFSVGMSCLPFLWNESVCFLDFNFIVYYFVERGLAQEQNPEERLTQLQHNLNFCLQELLLIFGWKEKFESSCLIRPVCHNIVVYVNEESVRPCQKLLKYP